MDDRLSWAQQDIIDLKTAERARQDRERETANTLRHGMYGESPTTGPIRAKDCLNMLNILKELLALLEAEGATSAAEPVLERMVTIPEGEIVNLCGANMTPTQQQEAVAKFRAASHALADAAIFLGSQGAVDLT